MGERLTRFALLLVGGFVGAAAMLWWVTGFDEASEQIRSFRYMRAQERHWDRGIPAKGPTTPNWNASLELAAADLAAPMTEAELLADFRQWELLERCSANGVAKVEGIGELRPRSLTPEAAARFIGAWREEKRALDAGAASP